jgi:hypothetical protein
MPEAHPFTQIATVDLDIAILGQLSPSNLALRDQFEPGSVKVVGFETPFRAQDDRCRIPRDVSLILWPSREIVGVSEIEAAPVHAVLW